MYIDCISYLIWQLNNIRSDVRAVGILWEFSRRNNKIGQGRERGLKIERPDKNGSVGSYGGYTTFERNHILTVCVQTCICVIGVLQY